MFNFFRFKISPTALCVIVISFHLASAKKSFMKAVAEDDVGAVRNLLKKSKCATKFTCFAWKKSEPLLGKKDSSGRPPLDVAVMRNNIDMVNALLEFAAPVYLTNDEGNTPLHRAACGDRPDIVKALANKCDSPTLEMKDVNNRTALTLAVMGEKVENVRILVDAGANVNALNPVTLEITAHVVARTGNVDIFKILAERKVLDLEAVNAAHETPLIVAVNNVKLDMMRALMAKGADPNNGVGEQMHTPLHHAVRNKNAPAVNVLLENVATDVFMMDRDGITPYMIAEAEGYYGILKSFKQNSGIPPSPPAESE